MHAICNSVKIKFDDVHNDTITLDNNEHIRKYVKIKVDREIRDIQTAQLTLRVESAYYNQISVSKIFSVS